MKKVVLEPCELHTSSNILPVNGGKILSCMSLYAGFWDIKSCDMETHKKFCELANRYNIFKFYNSGMCNPEGKPATIDDGVDNLSWYSNLAWFCRECLKQGILVEVNISKKSVLCYGISHNYGNYYQDNVAERLFYSYLSAVCEIFDRNSATKFIKTRIKNVSKAYKYVLSKDYCKIIVDKSISEYATKQG